MTELKPCPFCGGEATYGYVDVQEDYTGYWIQKPTVRCNGCYINVGDHINNDYAAEDWNARQPAFDWKPIEELPEKVDKSFVRIVVVDARKNDDFELMRYGTSERLRNFLIEQYTHYALLTPPEAK